REPMTGIKPITDPIREFFCGLFMSKAFLNAPRGPECMARPKAISPITPVKPISRTKIIYGIRNAAPPNSPMRYGNIHMFAMPTELPMQEMTKPHLLLNLSSDTIFLELIENLSFLLFPAVQ